VFDIFHNNNLYNYVEMIRASVVPFHNFAKLSKKLSKNTSNPFLSDEMLASYELFERLTRRYTKPQWHITSTTINNKKVSITPEIVSDKSFCNLIHFKKSGKHKQQKLLIVAPMAGHYATLLQGTIKGLISDFDIYITDWKNARDIPISQGQFGFADYTDYCLEFMQSLGKDLNILAVCQPAVPVLCATAIMAQDNHPQQPKTLTLMGGPIDTRISPTQVNNYAIEHTINWFEENVITRVPLHYDGYMRRVYPGFVQLSGFMAMNMRRHISNHIKLFYHLIKGDGESASAHKKFYNEYLAVMDLPAEFFLESVRIVFRDHLLPQGKLTHKGKKIDLSAIKKTSLLCIEGEKDDIYGIFNGHLYRTQIAPAIKKFIKSDATPQKP